jgi:hypothetical protein
LAFSSRVSTVEQPNPKKRNQMSKYLNFNVVEFNLYTEEMKVISFFDNEKSATRKMEEKNKENINIDVYYIVLPEPIMIKI